MGVRLVNGPCASATVEQVTALRRAGGDAGVRGGVPQVGVRYASDTRDEASVDEAAGGGGRKGDEGLLTRWMWAALLVQNVAIVAMACGRCGPARWWCRGGGADASKKGRSL